MADIAELDRVDIVLDEGEYFVVYPVWKNVDRPISSSFSCGKRLDLAKRLENAFLDGVAYDHAQIKRDVNDKTYVDFQMKIRMRSLNAELNRLGY